METKYHQLIPRLIFPQMPEAFRDFFAKQGYTPEMMDEDAIRPDEQYHDNLMQGPGYHWAHSYKQQIVDGKLRYCQNPSGGECLERVKACAINIRNWHTSPDSYMMLCHELIIASHYVIDSHTYPHLIKGKPWSDHHASWELSQAKWIEKGQEWIGNVVAEPYKDIYKAFVADARMMYYRGQKVVEKMEQSEPMSEEESVGLAKFIAGAVKRYWLTVTDKFWK